MNFDAEMLILLLGLLLTAGLFLTRHLIEKKKILEEELSFIEESYENVSCRLDAVRRYHHDLAKHIRILERMSETEESVTDSILWLKKQECSEKGIQLKTQIEKFDYGKIQEKDMTTLLYNLLDNAIEAAERNFGGG